MGIEKASMKDLGAIMLLISDCTNNMINRGIDQWDSEYPNSQVISEDIHANHLYLFKEDDVIKGIVTVNEEQEDEYATVQWEYQIGKQLIVHRLAVSPDYQDQGIGKKLMNFVETMARELNYSAIRLDTYSKNQKAMNFYDKLDYKNRGAIYFPHRKAPFYVFEKFFPLL